VVTMSFGTAGFRPGQATTVEDLLKQADAALYEAKEAGRNRVGVADDEPT
jgi:diguanylate cyclase (GGDEF)-like protein